MVGLTWSSVGMFCAGLVMGVTPFCLSFAADKERAMQLLRSRGIEPPLPGEKGKIPIYGKKRERKKKENSTAESTTVEQKKGEEDGDRGNR